MIFYRAFVSAVSMVVLLMTDPCIGYERAIEGNNNVKNKIYPRKKRFELAIPNGGLILNQSYVDTFLISGGFVYHFSEEWGFGADFSLASNSDKPERFCIENFYNDPNKELSSPCGDVSALDELGEGRKANYGPAYVPVREIQNIISLSAVWTPVYGKQLVFMSATSYFDLYFEIGGAFVSSLYYDKQETLRNGNPSRGAFNDDGDPSDGQPIGAQPDEIGSYGIDGRPDPEAQSNIALNFGIGQKFHFGRRFHLKVFLRNMTLLGIF